MSRDNIDVDIFNTILLNSWNFAYDNPIYFIDRNGNNPCASDEGTIDIECLKEYQEAHLPPNIKSYNEILIPNNITFTSSPVDLQAPDLWENGHLKKPGIPGWQYTQGMSGLCGQISVAAVLNRIIGGVSVNDVILMWRLWNEETKNTEDDIEYTETNQLAWFINVKYGEKAHAWNGGPPNLLTAAAWNGQTAVMESLLSSWFSQGTFVITKVRIDPGIRTEKNPISIDHHGGHLVGGSSVNHGKTCTRYHFWLMQDYEASCYGALHWVVVTGVSDQWINDSSEKSIWKWVRIFNPFQGQTEYYWWYDFKQSWTGDMLRVDPANADDTCTISGGYCTK